METITLFEKSVMLVVMLSAPALIAAIVVGVIISLLQTVFQIQDQTLPFAIKLIAVTIVLAITSSWLGGELSILTERVFLSITDVGR